MTLTPWQRANVLDALKYLRDLGRTGPDARADALAHRLMEVLEPSRRTVRMQREAAQAASAGAQAGRERRAARERRNTGDRRRQQLPFVGPDRRAGADRRALHRRNS
jgi:hypothetical protein